MAEQQLLERISIDPRVMAGSPVIAGTRLPVVTILRLFAYGATAADILEEYQHLTPEDIQACFLFASKSLETVAFLPLVTEPA